MKLFKPNFWQNKIGFYSILLFPITFVFSILIYLRKFFYFQKEFNVPIICVGNIYIGGTGKTPLSILIANHLRPLKKAAIVKKYYTNHKDEHNLINSKSDCLILNRIRSKGIEEAIKKKFDFIILDDGFQDYSIKKNLNIICFNSNQLIGNGMIFPSGPLRNSMRSLKDAQIVVVNGSKNLEFEKKLNTFSKKTKIYYSKYLPVNLEQFKNKKLLAFAGIGNNENFFKILKDSNLDVRNQINFPDHYEYDKDELKKIINTSKKDGHEIITTEKDYFRIKEFGLKEIKYLKVKLEIVEKEKFLSHVKNYL